jgi:hypothetical protein
MREGTLGMHGTSRRSLAFKSLNGFSARISALDKLTSEGWILLLKVIGSATILALAIKGLLK